MAFIVKKKIHGKEYYYLNETKRINGKVVSKCLGYLGKDKKDAEKKAKQILGKTKAEKDKKENMEKVSVNENKVNNDQISIDELANFCKREGFIFKSSEIYGGFAGFWDFGPLGVELFNNIKKDWWSYFIHQKNNMVGIEASIISHPRTWKASGHIASFNDLAVNCSKCKFSTKIDKSDV